MTDSNHNSPDLNGADSPEMDDDAREDGRHLRVDRGRRIAVDAAVSILAKGELLLSIDQIAEESGLSRRTLFRYFGSVDGLVQEMMSVYVPVVLSLFSTPPIKGPLESRVRGLLSIHVEFVKQFGHLARSIDRIADTAPTASEAKVLRAESFRRQTEAWLLSEFKFLPAAITTQVLILTSFDTVNNMYAAVGDETIDALTRTIVQTIKNA
jgi:AcrR family transcriptional regulator